MKDVRLLQTVEQPCIYGATETGPVPLNPIATRGAYPTTRSEAEGMVREVWKIAEGSEISLPDPAAATLVGLGYAEDIVAPSAG